jgi:hypothetical protein
MSFNFTVVGNNKNPNFRIKVNNTPYKNGDSLPIPKIVRDSLTYIFEETTDDKAYLQWKPGGKKYYLKDLPPHKGEFKEDLKYFELSNDTNIFTWKVTCVATTDQGTKGDPNVTVTFGEDPPS